METRNPILRNAEKNYAEYGSVQGGPGSAPAPGTGQGSAGAAQLTGVYPTPTMGGSAGSTMTLADVITKTAICFGILLFWGVIGWFTAASFLWVIGMIVGLTVGLVCAFKKTVSPPLVMIYAAAQGLMLGGISAWYQAFGDAQGWGNIVFQAVTGTLIVFAVMLTLYQTRIIKVTGKFQKIFMVALFSYVAIGLLSLVFYLISLAFHQGSNFAFGFFGVGTIGIIVCALAIILAAFALCMDFESVSEGLRYGVPESESWRMAFGLMVTLIWLYLEILRLLTILAASRD